MGVLSGLKPEKVFYYFEEICKIPHGSGNVDQISDYLADFAKQRGLSYLQDTTKNIIISKEASAGYEDSEGVILQGHMDMVAVKKPGSTINMLTDGLKLKVDGDYVYAEDTSLGGDDGIAIAYALAILDDDSIPHPHLDVVITVDEEVGMDGAKAIDISGLKGTRLLNLDSEEEGYFLVGCAGGARVEHFLPVVREEREGISVTCKVEGLQGGHSGDAIDKERGNANSLQGRVLDAILQVGEIGVYDLQGGLADNAIPRECELKFIVAEENVGKVQQAVAELEKDLQAELAVKDPDVKISFVKEGSRKEKCLDQASCENIMRVLLAMPNGVQAMSADIKGLVQTSLNNGIIKLKEEELTFVTSVRSSIASEKQALIKKISAVTALAGGTAKVFSDYPGWAYKADSVVRDKCIEVYREMYGKEPIVRTIHAGLECGLLLEKRPDLDCVSMGPDMCSIHTTEEKLSISSTERVWKYLCKLLAALK